MKEQQRLRQIAFMPGNGHICIFWQTAVVGFESFCGWVGCGVFVARVPISDYGLWISSLEGCFFPVFTLGLEGCRLFLHAPTSPSALFSLYFYTIKRRFPHILDPLPAVVCDAHTVAGSREFSQFSCSSLSLGCASRSQEWGFLDVPALPSWQPNPAFLVCGRVSGGREFPDPSPALRSRLLPDVQHQFLLQGR